MKRRALRDLPGLVLAAVRLAWAAGPRELVISALLQVLIGIGTAAQLLVGRDLLAGFLTATRGTHGLESLIPGAILLGLLTVMVSFSAAVIAEEQRLLR